MHSLGITCESRYDTFIEVAVITFKEQDNDDTTDDNINWGRIVSLFTFCKLPFQLNFQAIW